MSASHIYLDTINHDGKKLAAIRYQLSPASSFAFDIRNVQKNIRNVD